VNGGRLVLIVAGVVLIAASAAGIPLAPHRWVGISTATLIGWMLVLFVPALIVSLLLVALDHLRQLKRHAGANTRQLNKIEEHIGTRGKVIEGPWRRSG
jgi:membrane protein implicated in regulation of membrane protease activity